MPNLASAIKEEIVRLSRKESRSQLGATKQATLRHRREIAALKRQVSELARQVALLSRRTLAPAATPAAAAAGKVARFSAKGLRLQRERLELSAGDFGKLLGVSAQSVYNWEHEKARPRAAQISGIAALRSLGKREARARLEQIASTRKPGKRKS